MVGIAKASQEAEDLKEGSSIEKVSTIGAKEQDGIGPNSEGYFSTEFANTEAEDFDGTKNNTGPAAIFVNPKVVSDSSLCPGVRNAPMSCNNRAERTDKQSKSVAATQA